MTGPITPHFEVTEHPDGVHLRLKQAELVVPAQMALDIADLITHKAWASMDRPPVPLPVVRPNGDPIK